MAQDTLKYWVVVRDGRGKWLVVYDPRYTVKNGERFAFEATAEEYKKKQAKKDVDAAATMARRQTTLLTDGVE